MLNIASAASAVSRSSHTDPVNSVRPTSPLGRGEGGIRPNAASGPKSVQKFTTMARNAALKRGVGLLMRAPQCRAQRMQLVAMAKRVVSSRGSALDSARKETDNPTEQMLVLEIASSEMSSDGGENDFMQQIRAAQQAIDEEHATQIRAELNAFEASWSFGKTDAEAANFRAGYSSLVALALAGDSLAGSIDEILKRFKKNLRQALTLLLQVAGEELDTQWASCEPEYLHLLRGILYDAASFAMVLDQWEKFFELLRKKNALVRDQVEDDEDTVKITRELVKIGREKWVVPLKFSSMADRYMRPSTHWRLYFLGRVHQTLRKFPDRLFFDDVSRDRTLSAIQEAVDGEAEKEPL
ncbi:TyeA family type III secretion system gatekeeper subunit [Glaciimonas sp. GG7]